MIMILYLCNKSCQILCIQHFMETYCQKMYRGYLEKDPEYKIPPLAKRSPDPADDMKPMVTGIKIHEHGSEVALVLEGRNLWFCYQLSINGENTSTPACDISGTSIKLNFDKGSRTSLSSLTDGEEIKVKVHNHFLKSPSPTVLKVQKKVRSICCSHSLTLVCFILLCAFLQANRFTGV